MGIRPSSQSSPGVVEKYIGTDVDSVIEVGNNISDVIIVADNIDDVNEVADNIDNINLIADNISTSLKYLGAFTENPTVRVNGDPLEAGDYYLNTVSNTFFYLGGDLITWIESDTQGILDAATRAEQSELAAKASENAALISETNASNSEIAAKASEDTSSANADATADDLILTNADRLATQADAIATASDRVQTEADRVTTGNDVITTGSDRVQTGLDRVQTGLDATSTQADALQTAADRVQTQADASQTNSDRLAVETLYDTFDDRYLGTKTSDPSVDNDGDPLQIGATYFNSTSNSTKFYNGATWEDPEATATQAALTATTKANEATISATNASNSEGEAANSASSAAASATIATNKAGEATVEANIATNAASAASASEIEATNQANIASTKAIEAEASADAASISEGNALDSETSASIDADRAEEAVGLIEAQKSAMTKADFFALAEKRIRDNVGSGDAHVNMDFDDYFKILTFEANEIPLEARTRMVNGIEYFAPQITLTLPAASDVETLVSNQTLIMFETKVVNVSASDVFYAGADGDSTPITWSSLTYLQQTEYMQDFKNNVYNDNDELKQYVFNHVVTNLAQDYAKGDPQAIIDAGYTQGVVGDTYVQWTKADVEAAPLGKIQRRNQGAYHPSYNSNGCNTDASGNKWDESGFSPTTTAECFSQKGANGDITPGIAGGISGRSDGKFYDAIYDSDVDDLRMSSRRVPWSQIRKEGRAKAIAGELRGFEGVPFTHAIYDETVEQDSVGTPVSAVYVSDGLNKYEAGRTYRIFNTTSGNSVFVTCKTITSTVFDWTGQGTAIDRRDQGLVIADEEKQFHSQSNPSWTSIIGDPARIAATFPDGVEGEWIPQIPDGTTQTWSLNRKSLSSATESEFSLNNGTFWSTDSRTINTTTNSYTLAQNALIVRLDHYETQANFTENTVIQEALDLGGIHATSEATNKIGYDLVVSLIGKVPTNTNAPSRGEYALDTFTLNIDRKPNTNPANVWSHKVITLGSENNSPAAKFIDYLSETNGVAELCYTYKEMIYDSGADFSGATELDGTSTSILVTAGVIYRVINGNLGGNYVRALATNLRNMTSYSILNGVVLAANGTVSGAFELASNGWGDDNQFQHVNNQESFTDDNSNTGLRGTAKAKLPYFIDRSY